MVPSSTNITFACPSCKTQLSVPASMAGVTGPCPTCQNQLTAPDPAVGPAAVQSAPPQQPAPQPEQSAPPPQQPAAQQPAAQQPAAQQQAPPQHQQSPLGQQPIAAQHAAPPQQQPIPGQIPQAQMAPPLPQEQQGPPQQAAPHGEIEQQGPPQQAAPHGEIPSNPMQSAPPMAPPAMQDPGQAAPDLSAASAPPAPGKSGFGKKQDRAAERLRSGKKEKAPRGPKAKGGSGRLIAIAAGVALLAGGAMAIPKLTGFFRQANIPVPETASLDADVPVKQATNEQSSDARVPADLPLAPADGHLANPNMPPRLIDEPDLVEPQDESEAFADVEGILDEPKGFIQAYLTAPRWENLVDMTLKGEELRPAMAAYYKKNPYAQEKALEITFQHKQRLPDSERQFYLFKVITDSNKGSFPMTVEETSSGLRTDWEAYVQFKDAHLQKFLDNPVVGKDGKGEIKTFNVILRRAHDFTDDVPDSENKWCYKIDAPVDDLQGGFSFIPKFSQYGKDLDTKLKWLLLYFPIVDLRWEVDANHPGSKPYVRLMKIRQFNWRGHGGGEGGGLDALTEASISEG